MDNKKEGRSASLEELLNMSTALGERVQEFHAEDSIRSRHLRTLFDRSDRLVRRARKLHKRGGLRTSEEG